MELNHAVLERIVSTAIAEDLGAGDVTAAAVVPERARALGRIVCRAPGVVAGLPMVKEVFRQISRSVRFLARVDEGEAVTAGKCAAEVIGPARAVLAGERVALNFLQRLSGIATLTRRCVEAVAGLPVMILDTRKTTPGLRHLEKYAVRVGGGANHRFGLYDQVLIKDNHLRTLLPDAGDLPGAVKEAVRRAREHVPPGMRVEVETEDLDMVRAAMEAGADIIMLDNMALADMREACALVRERRVRNGTDTPITEASGDIRPERLRAIAETGVDAISLGMLTHSAPALDIAMDFVTKSEE